MAETPHNHRLNINAKPKSRLLWWVKQFCRTRAEWEAVKRAAEEAIKMRQFWFDNLDKPGRTEWAGPTAATIIESAAPDSIMRQCQLLQVVLETVRHKGCDLSDYVYRRKKERAAA